MRHPIEFLIDVGMATVLAAFALGSALRVAAWFRAFEDRAERLIRRRRDDYLPRSAGEDVFS